MGKGEVVEDVKKEMQDLLTCGGIVKKIQFFDKKKIEEITGQVMILNRKVSYRIQVKLIKRLISLLLVAARLLIAPSWKKDVLRVAIVHFRPGNEKAVEMFKQDWEPFIKYLNEKKNKNLKLHKLI